MKLHFHGAAGGVTGSKHIIEVNQKRILLDCGLFQGHWKEAQERNEKFSFDPASIDVLVLSHAHIDHSGAIPSLVKHGFQGIVYCTHATRDLCAVMLQDSAHIQERDAEYWNKNHPNDQKDPIYTIQDAQNAISRFRSVNYYQTVHIAPDITMQFLDAGHILGSTLEAWDIQDQDTGQRIRLGFTGDLGRKDLPILKDREQLENLDVLITESTYGDRLHDEIAEVEKYLAADINEALEKGGKVIIPAFAVERTQEVLFVIKKLQQEKKIPSIPIFIDSPLAVKATSIFQLHPECFDTEMSELINQGKDPFLEQNGVQFIQDVEASKALNNFPHSCLIISASGMCEFGRIKHHLYNNLADEKNTVLIVGWMAQDTLGRKLIDGASSVKIFKEEIPVRAKISIYNAFSGHGDQKTLLDFADKSGSPASIFLVHGENPQQEVLKQKLLAQKSTAKSQILIPSLEETYALRPGKIWEKIT
jgi:metallo-beta-lactamase family protein